MNDVLVIAAHALRESFRRRVFVVVVVLTTIERAVSGRT